MQVEILTLLREIGLAVQETVRKNLAECPLAERISIDHTSDSDVIYKIDVAAEKAIVAQLNQHAKSLGGIVLIAEGIGEHEITVYPEGLADEAAAWRIMMDPIDGTRGIMYDKRSAFYLAGAAPNKGKETKLSDIEIAVMTELPTSRAAVVDECWAIRDQGAHGQRINLFTGERCELKLKASTADTIRGGFAQLSRFFPPGRNILAAMDDELMESLFPDAKPNEILCFEDQYICTGGQLYEIITGKDRFNADLRAAVYESKHFVGKRVGHVCHPYDLAAMLVATEVGVILTDVEGHALDCPMETTYPVNWIGYANTKIQAELESTLQSITSKYLA